MTPGQTFRELANRGISIIADGRGRPSLDDPSHRLDDTMLAAAREHLTLLAWALEGANTGHIWHACNVCDEVQLLEKPKGCVMTFECEGSMEPIGRCAKGQRCRDRDPRATNASGRVDQLELGVTLPLLLNMRNRLEGDT